LIHGGRRYGIECRYGDAPTMTKSLHVALADLKLDRAWIVYPGRERYAVHEKVEVLSLAEIPGRLGLLVGRQRERRRHGRGKTRGR
jgi:hypothetical protein